MFEELLSSVGTKNYRYDVFNDKVMNSTTGLSVGLDKWADNTDHTLIDTKNEQMILSIGFLDRNTSEALDCL